MAVHLPKGTRDFMPRQMAHRLEVIARLRSQFERYGFGALETPAFERLDTLMGKYGGETEKLMFRIIKRGKGAETGQCDLGLRYDLTVPLARVVAMNPGLPLPFKRYQIQPVWRAERPQRGRFREFYQCDADIVGSTSPHADAEILALLHDGLLDVGFDRFEIRVNDRRILTELAQRAGAADAKQEHQILIAIDKLDKIGRDGVDAELRARGFTDTARLWEALEVPSGTPQALDALDATLDGVGRDGVATLRQVVRAAASLGVEPQRIVIDPSLARGADYYTGPVFEAWLVEGNMGALGAGGRYDGLIGHLSGRDTAAVGVSFGLERIVQIKEEAGQLYGDDGVPDALVVLAGDSQAIEDSCLRAAATLRRAGISVDVYLGANRKLRKQMKLAHQRGYRWAVMIGDTEAESGTVTLKHMQRGDQTTVPLDHAAQTIRSTTATSP